MNLKLGQPLPAKFVVLLGDTLITLMSLSASRLLHGGVHPVFGSVRAMDILQQGFGGGALPFPIIPLTGFAALFLCMFYVFDLYDLQIFGHPTTVLSRLFCAGGVVLVVASAVSLVGEGPWHQLELLQGVAMAITVAFAWRRFFAANSSILLRQESTAVIGAGPRAEYVRALMDRPESRYRFTGFVHPGEAAVLGSGVLGSVAELPDLVERHDIRQLVLATDSTSAAEFQGIGFRQSSDIAMELSQSLPIELLNQSWLRTAEKSDLLERHFMRKVKRVSDIVFSLTALFFFWPLLTLCAIAIRLESPGPVIFRQTRVGWHGKPFTIFKLRTMRDGSERRPQWAQVDDARITRIGRFLRRTHIDELPQLFNVLQGNMSFVGPRPERPEFVEQLNQQIPYYDVRHFLLPGITGWAQVNFRYGASVADARKKLEFDLYYVMHASLLLDLLVVLKTVQVVLFMRGSR